MKLIDFLNGKKQILTICIVFVVGLMLTTTIQQAETPLENISVLQNDSLNIGDLNTIKSSGDGSYYSLHNLYTINEETFNVNFGDWSYSDGGTESTIEIEGPQNRCHFERADPGDPSGFSEYPMIYYEPEPFYYGQIIIDWWCTGLESGESFEIRNATDTLYTCSNEENTVPNTYDLDYTMGTNESDFIIYIVLMSDDDVFDSGEDGYIDNLELTTYEFIVAEYYGDNIPQQNSQRITAYIAPPIGSIDTNSVEVRYKIDDSDLSSGYSTISSTGSDNYNQFIIPSTEYDYGENIYYQVVYEHSSTPEYSTSSGHNYFSAIDNTNPIISNYRENHTLTPPEYDDDVEVIINGSDIEGDSLLNATMYVKNGTFVDLINTGFPIQSNQSSLISDGEFKFIIPADVLTVRQTLYYMIRLIDEEGNYDDTTVYQINNVQDDTSPIINFVSIDDSTPNYDDDVTITYNIIEYLDSIGLYTSGLNVQLRYYIGSTPSGNYYTYTGNYGPTLTPISREGGNIEFIIPNSVIKYGDTIYYWLYVEDQNANYAEDYSAGRFFTVVDETIPSIIPYSSNTDNKNYMSDTTLSFIITEPIDASGLDLSTLKLHFKVNDPNLVSPQIIGYSSISPINTYNFVIGMMNYSPSDTVYYKIVASDSVPNTNETIFPFSSFNVVDLDGPFLNYQAGFSNDTFNPDYLYDINMTFNTVDEYRGEGLDNIVMFIKNGSAASYFGPGCIRIDPISNWGDNFRFVIDSSWLSARENLYWYIYSNDSVNNPTTDSGMIDIVDSSIPSILYSAISPAIIPDNYAGSVTINYTIFEPIMGAGFGTSGSNLQIRYYLGTVNDAPSNWNDGTAINSFDTLNIDGGEFRVTIPSDAYGKCNRVYYWGVAIDQDGNNATTFYSDLRYFDIVRGIEIDVKLDNTIITDKYYYSSLEPSLNATPDVNCDMWYRIDSSTESIRFVNSIEDDLTSLSEGMHTIKIYYFNLSYFKEFTFFLDYTAPEPVINVEIDIDGGIVILQWEPPIGKDDRTYYKIYRSESADSGFVLIRSTEIGKNSFHDLGTAKGKTYYYKIVAVDQAGNESDISQTLANKVTTPLSTVIYIAIVIAVGALVGIVVKVRSSAKTKAAIRSLGDITDDDMDKFHVSDDDLKKKRQSMKETGNYIFDDDDDIDSVQWQKIDWKEKASKGKYDNIIKKSDAGYWEDSIEKLIKNALELELDGKIFYAVRAYQIALRVAEIDKFIDSSTIEFIREKLQNIYSNPLTR